MVMIRRAGNCSPILWEMYIMTIEELMECVDVDIKTEYQHITTCPADPIYFEDHVYTFLGDTACKSNVIGKDDYRGLMALCFNAR